LREWKKRLVGVKKDLQQMGIRNWRNVAEERDEWRIIVLEANATTAYKAKEEELIVFQHDSVPE